MEAIKQILTREKRHLDERITDRQFADSWEQSSQISRDIRFIQEKIDALENFISKSEWNKTMAKIIHEEVFRKTINFRIHRLKSLGII